MTTTVYVRPHRVALVLLSLIATLVIADVVALLSGEQHLLKIFNLDAEQNIPTWYSSTLLLIAAALLGIVAVVMRAENSRYTNHWGFLSLIFVYLSCDDTAILHEKWNVLSRFLPSYTVLHFAWVLPFGVALTILGAIYFRFLLDLPPQTRLRFVVAGCLFAGLKLVVEVTMGYYLVYFGHDELVLATLVVIKEAFGKMLGTVVFIHALMTYLGSLGGDVRLAFKGPVPADP